MRLFHRHKWEYLGKEFHVRTITQTYSSGYISLGGYSTKEEKVNITTIRFFCRGCTKIKSQTVDGSIKTAEAAQIQGLDIREE